MLFSKKIRELQQEKEIKQSIYEKFLSNEDNKDHLVFTRTSEHEAFERGFNQGVKDGYVSGYQEAIFNMIDMFFNSDLAKEYKIDKLSAELSKTKRRSSDKIKSDYYTTLKWF